MMDPVLQVVGLLLGGLLVVMLAHVVARWSRIPASVLLVLVGLIYGFLPGPNLELDPELVLVVVIPPLLYAAALGSSLVALRGSARTVLGLSVGLVLATALAAGGLFGSGLTFGYPEYVPAAHTDFVIAALGEELGLAGTLAVVGLYVLVVHRGFHIALSTRDSFAELLAVGLTSVVGIQALVILGGTLKLMPLTGVTLPLLSYGGSSILANFILLGLLMSISHEAEARRAAEH